MAINELYLVRHGEDEGSNLTDRGREQAVQAGKVLTERLSSPHPTILTSDRMRAGQTADIIASQLDTEVIVSRKVGDGGNTPEIVRDLLPFLENCLLEAGVEYDDTTPLIVVTHAPMVAAATGVSTSAIQNCKVERYDGKTWKLPGY